MQVQSSESNQQNRFGVSNSLSAPSYNPSPSSGQNGAVLSQRNGYDQSFVPGRMPPSNGPIYSSYYMPQAAPMYHPSAYGGFGGNYGGYPANSMPGYQPAYYNPSAYYAQQQPAYAGAHSAGMNTYGNNMQPPSYQSQQQSQQSQQSQQYPAHFPSLGGVFRNGPGIKSEEQKKATQ